MSDTSLEAATQRIGTEIFERANAAAPSIVSMEHWQQFAMNWMTSDEDLKRRLFRLTEVLPSLRNRESIAKHLLEYLDRKQEGLPRLPMPMPLAVAFRNPRSPYAAFVAWATQFGSGIMGGRFNCGCTPEQAIASVLKLRKQKMAFTLDVLGETIIADRIAVEHQTRYLELINRLGPESKHWERVPLLDEASWGPIPPVNISLKLTAIVPKFDPIDPETTTRVVLDRLRPILRASRDNGVFLNIDMEHYAIKDLTLDIFKQVLMEPEFKDWPDCGIVIQCYMPEGDRDMAGLVDWARKRGTPITVRLVKGAYWDSQSASSVLKGWPNPLYTRKWQSDEAFERVANYMLENSDILRPAFASHNVRSIASVLARESALGLAPRTVEFQMLTGMGDQLKRALVSMNQRLRVYAPFGDMMSGMAYFIRRLIENTANESFLRQSFGENTPVRKLLRKPGEYPDVPATPLPKPFIQDPDEFADMKPFTNESDVDFSIAENRKAMQTSLGAVRGRFPQKCPAIVQNKPVETGSWFDSLNPSNPSEVVAKVAQCDGSTVDNAVAAAKRAAEDWAATPVTRRAEILNKAADLLSQRRFEAAAWIVLEVGKNWREAQGDVMEAVDYLRFYAADMARLDAKPRLRDYPGETNEYVYQPRGVVGVISPFCFPMALLTGMTAAALAAGNTVVAKPSPLAPASGAYALCLLIEAGLPAGVLNIVQGEGEKAGKQLVKNPDVDMIAFTGTAEVGNRIIEAARHTFTGKRMFKHVIADLGGKNAILVDDDADLDESVQAALSSSFGYAGQKCTACSRAIVLDAVYDDFLAKLTEAASAIKPAASELPGTSVGPMIDKAAVDRVKKYVEIGKGEAKCVLEGGEPKDFFVSPIIFADVPPDAKIAQDEIFGPVLCVIRAKTFEDAVRIANDSPYGLVAGVYSRSPKNIALAKQRLQVGILYVNRQITASHVDRQPFGGFKMSGLGTKTGGPDYLQQFMLPRTIAENTMRHGFAPPREGTESKGE